MAGDSQHTAYPKLLNLFIFNSTYGQKEGHEHEKILFYYPNSADLDTQVRHVGLAEAITRFSSTFRKDGDCEAVHTQKTRQLFMQPEPNIWMVMTVAIGWVSRMRESGPVREYQSEAVQDVVLRACLASLYRTFALRHSSFNAVLEARGLEGLKATLESFLTSYMSSVELSSGDILTVWSGVSFLPLDRQTFLRIHCCLSLLQASFPSIAHTAFFYNQHIVWCGLAMEDLRSLSQYLNTQLLPSRKDSPHLLYLRPPSPPPTRPISPGSWARACLRRSTGCWSLKCHSWPVTSGSRPARRRGAGQEQKGAAGVGEGVQGAAVGGTFRYVYHNHMNLATKSTVHAPNQPLPAEVMRAIADMHSDMEKCQSGELVVKTSQDHWIVGRCGDGREFYVVVNHKNANLVEVTDEVSRMCASHFSNIFMIE
ncbi:vacuolar fusion protein CCZ1 homolog [Scylla paramamosain]|uniref:vacuolar fusion protein CCZ1 homolog n=1 Tax=Scylla paramamosain TaxID=85552 RepID=UPI003082C36C